MRIAVVSKGVSEEREVSLLSGERVARALRKAGQTVCEIRLDTELPSKELMGELALFDAVFLALHGGAGEDGRVQRALEDAGILHYTGSNPIASARAMDKARAKQCVEAYGIPVARGRLLLPGEIPSHEPPFLPLVVKPSCGGSSIGFFCIRQASEWRALAPAQPMLCEEYLPGREYSVGVLGNRALPPVEICVPDGEYDYAHKYRKGAARELCPAPVDGVKQARIQTLALAAFSALSLRDYARIDFREDASGAPVFLEANTLPGMTETSLFPLAASAAGLCEQELCVQMAQMAARRKKPQTGGEKA